MKSAVQTISRESNRPDSDLAIVPPAPVVIQLPRPSQEIKRIPRGETVQWQWDHKFSVSCTPGVFNPSSATAQPQLDGSYLTFPALRVVGNPNDTSTCTYTSLRDAMAADPPPPPPPNVIIVDNSGLKGSGEK